MALKDWFTHCQNTTVGVFLGEQRHLLLSPLSGPSSLDLDNETPKVIPKPSGGSQLISLNLLW